MNKMFKNKKHLYSAKQFLQSIKMEQKGCLDFHLQLMKPIFERAARKEFKMIDLIDSIEKHPTKKWRKVSIEDKTKIIVHQTACWANAHEIARYDIRKNNWPGFPYHFFICQNGDIMQVNKLTDMSYHAKHANKVGIGVALQGRLYSSKCEGIEWAITHSFLDKGDNLKKVATPTTNQMISLIQVFDYLQIKVPHIWFDGIVGHCNISPRSRPCDPGDAIMLLLQVYKYWKSQKQKGIL